MSFGDSASSFGRGSIASGNLQRLDYSPESTAGSASFKELRRHARTSVTHVLTEPHGSLARLYQSRLLLVQGAAHTFYVCGDCRIRIFVVDY
jgi:hypothetical protein